MIIVIANIYVKDGKTVEFLEAAKQCIAETVKEEGCIQYTLVADVFDSNKFAFVEKWRDKASLDLHMKTAHFKVLGDSLGELVAKKGEIEVFEANKLN